METYTDSKCEICDGKIIKLIYLCHLLKKLAFWKKIWWLNELLYC